MRKRSIDDVNVEGQRVLVRLDLNVPLNDGRITDDRRIRAALPTIKKIVGDGGRAILMSHLGRPCGDAEKDRGLTLAPVAERLAELLDQGVSFNGATVGDEARQLAGALGNGEICLLENLRFHDAETIKDKKAAADANLRAAKDSFAAELASMADVYVNDAFGTCHRDNASMLTVPQQLAGKPRVIGYLVAKELEFLGNAVSDPARPFVVVLGGAKVSDKVGAIAALLEKCDTLLIGGAMAYTFAAAEGQSVGKSLVEPERFEIASELQTKAGDRLKLPVDTVAAAEISAKTTASVCGDEIPDDLMGLDIGPETIAGYRDVLLSARTVVWNGPMGVFEVPPFDTGTIAIANAVAEASKQGAISVIGGGDSAAAVEVAGVAERISHVSTGGGASLEFLEGKPFAAIEVLDNA